MKQPGIIAIEWHGRGCRCLLLRAELSPRGWRVEIPQTSGSVPNTVPSAMPGGWTGDAADEWIRFPNRGALVWHLPLDRERWMDVQAVTLVHEKRNGETVPKPTGRFSVAVSCNHGVQGQALTEFLADVEEFVARRTKVSRTLTL